MLLQSVWHLRASLHASQPSSSRASPLRPIQRLDENEREFLRVALHNYTRCLCTGDGYDLRVVFRIVQLWLR